MTEVRCLTIQQVADHLQISYSAAYRLVRSGALQSIRVGKAGRRVTTQQLDQFISSGGVSA